jgi:hypothetical protein
LVKQVKVEGFECLTVVVMKNLLEYNAVQPIESQQHFGETLLPDSACYLLIANFWSGLFLNSEEGGDKFLLTTD